MNDNSPAEMVQRMMDGFYTGDLAAAMQVVADDAVWYDQGTNSRAGTYRGKDAILAHTGQIFALTDGTLASTMADLMSGRDHAATVERVTAQRLDRILDLHVSTLYRAKGGKIVAWHILPTDQTVWDSFWA
jgi:ketosteroid isomerase-like protein